LLKRFVDKDLDETKQTLDAILAGEPEAIRAQKRLCKLWEEAPLYESIEVSIDAFAKSYESGEPRKARGRVPQRAQKAACTVKRAIKLLVVEDSEDDARMVVKVLQRAGFKVLKYEIAGTPAATQAALAREPWDAVISDFNMPDFNGLDALRIVRAAAPDIPFILISGAVGEEIAVDALKAGVGDYVLKKNLSAFRWCWSASCAKRRRAPSIAMCSAT
jgi:CheY-like chemotaxis protein